MKETKGESFTKWPVWGCKNHVCFHPQESIMFAEGKSRNRNKTEIWHLKSKTGVEGTNVRGVNDNRRSEVLSAFERCFTFYGWIIGSHVRRYNIGWPSLPFVFHCLMVLPM